MQTALRQLHLAHVYVQQFVPDAAPLLPPDLAQEAAEVVKKVEQNVFVSQLQRDVGHMLGMLKAAESSVVGAGWRCWLSTSRQGIRKSITMPTHMRPFTSHALCLRYWIPYWDVGLLLLNATSSSGVRSKHKCAALPPYSAWLSC